MGDSDESWDTRVWIGPAWRKIELQLSQRRRGRRISFARRPDQITPIESNSR